MTREEAIDFANALKNNYTIDFDKLPEFCDMAISALSKNKGEWMAYDHGMGLVYLKCPFCGMTIDKRHVEHNFCGRCGAKLSGEKLVLLR